MFSRWRSGASLTADDAPKCLRTMKTLKRGMTGSGIALHGLGSPATEMPSLTSEVKKQRSLRPAKLARSNTFKPSAAGPEGFRSLIGNLERALCVRLERIEASLQTLHRSEATEAGAGMAGGSSRTRAQATQSEEEPSVSHLDDSPLAAAPFCGGGCAEALHASAVAPQGQSGSLDPARGLAPWHREVGGGGGGGAGSAASQQTSVVLRPEWQEGTDRQSVEGMVVLIDQRLESMDWARSGEDDVFFGGDGSEHLAEKPWWILLPACRFRLTWDIVMMLIIVHDMAVVPVNLAFNTGDNVVSSFMFWPFLLFWTFDMPLSFVTGFYTDGRIEVRTHRIVCRYARTWFLLDLFMVGSTWFEVVVDEESQGFLLGRVGKSLRILKVMRTFRFLRLAKLQKITEDFHERITSEYNRILVSVLKLILTIVWLNHFIACSWWALGVHTSEGGTRDSWTRSHRMEGASLWFQYSTSLHWSLTQFTPAGMEVSACNTPERIFSVSVLLFAMVAFSSFVSSITAHITQLRQLNDRHDANFLLLRRYLRFHQVPMELTLRILQCVEFRLGKQKREIQEGQVQYLQFLSKPLQLELSLRIFAPIVTQHPFFRRYAEVDSEAMRRICLEAVAQCLLSTEDLLFTEGGICEQMFFIMSGQLRYSFRGRRGQTGEVSDSASFVGHESFLEETECCCEVSMWCPWVHCGTMSAHRMSEVLAVDVAAFTGVTRLFVSVNRFTVRYAKLFAERTNEHFLEGNAISDISSFSDTALEIIVKQSAMKRRLDIPVTPVSPRDGTSRVRADMI